MIHHALASEGMKDKEGYWAENYKCPQKVPECNGVVCEFQRQTLGKIVKITINQLCHLNC